MSWIAMIGINMCPLGHWTVKWSLAMTALAAGWAASLMMGRCGDGRDIFSLATAPRVTDTGGWVTCCFCT